MSDLVMRGGAESACVILGTGKCTSGTLLVKVENCSSDDSR